MIFAASTFPVDKYPFSDYNVPDGPLRGKETERQKGSGKAPYDGEPVCFHHADAGAWMFLCRAVA